MYTLTGMQTGKDNIMDFLNSLIEKDRVLDMKKLIINTPEEEVNLMKATLKKDGNSYYFDYDGNSIDVTNLMW